MKSLVVGIKHFLKDEEGATMIEYGLLAALISVVCVAVLTLIGTNLDLVFDRICDALSGAVGGGGCA